MAKSRSLTIDPSAYAKLLKAIRAEIAAGRRVKRFVEKILNLCPFIIVKTYKDQNDKYDRYLVDIFYSPGENDSQVVASKGKFLNQELLDAGLAGLNVA